jgi:GNAT superfamily N-acetyltransferase
MQSAGMNITIKEISSLETHQVRLPVLRKGMTREDCIFKGDDLETTIHLGAFQNSQIVGVATFLVKSNTDIQSNAPHAAIMYQLRGMGVLENNQGQGIGAELIKYAEHKLKDMNAAVLWFHARTSALEFYNKMGYKVLGEQIHLEPAGPHFKMYKEL